MDLKRRGFLFGSIGFVAGGALATATGLGAYYYRRRQRRLNAGAAPAINWNNGSAGLGLDDWVLTEEDLDMLAELEAVPTSEKLELLDDVDIPGAGDYRSERVSGIDQCVSMCENDGECNAFTFARLSHPLEDKRHMCWLKRDRNPETLVSDIFYISGRRP